MEKKLNVEILPPAQAELEEIARVHMALSGPQSARRVTNKIFHAIEQMALFPLSGPLVQDSQLSEAGYRYILAAKYLVFYRVFNDTVVIYHIAHGATDYPKLFK